MNLKTLNYKKWTYKKWTYKKRNYKKRTDPFRDSSESNLVYNASWVDPSRNVWKSIFDVVKNKVMPIVQKCYSKVLIKTTDKFAI